MDTTERTGGELNENGDESFAFSWNCPPNPLDPENDQEVNVRIAAPRNERPPGSDELAGSGGPDHELLVQFKVLFTLNSRLSSADTTGATVLNKYLLVSLEKTEFNPRPDETPGDETPGSSGWYVDDVEIHMAIVNPIAGLTRDQDSPGTFTLTGSQSSSISKTIDVGFFATDLTGSASKTWTHSVSIDITDFGTHNYSTEDTVKQQLTMNMTADANTYKQPEDLFTGFPRIWNPKMYDALPSLRVPPPVATSNLPLYTQALYVAPGDTNAKSQFEIALTPSFVCVRPTERLYHELSPELQKEALKTPGAPVAELMSQLNQTKWVYWEIARVKKTLKWHAEVDFSQIGLALQ